MKKLILAVVFLALFSTPAFAKASVINIGSIGSNLGILNWGDKNDYSNVKQDNKSVSKVEYKYDDQKYETGKMYDYKHSNKKTLLANPLVVLYPNGPHGIVGESGVDHEGIDFVIRDLCDKWKFRQWFYGTSSTEGLHGDYSIWEPAKKCAKHLVKLWNNHDRKDEVREVSSVCPKDWILVPNASENWGDYLKPNTDYCVHTEDF